MKTNNKEIKERAHKINWREFSAMEEKDKIVFLNNSQTGNPFHVLFSQQFDRKILDLLCKVADKARLIHKNRDKGRKFLKNLLFGTFALNFFSQPSSRTFLSFETAQEILGMGIRDIRDPNTSSEAKGESMEDSIRTFSSYVDLIVMRHPEAKAVERGVWVLNRSDRRIPIISGGSGPDQHPTQALLDIYTIYKSFDRKVDNKTIIMIGDLLRGRTVRSLSYFMKNYKNMKLIFVSPRHLRMKKDIKDFLKRHKISYQEENNFKKVIPLADVIYMTRIQDEWDKGKNKQKSHESVGQGFKFKAEYLNLMKKKSILMHPLPKRDEIDVELDYCGDPRIIYWRQERNGMWARVALIAMIFQKNKIF
ncbi:aspartate carbamoyltransferase [Patescibacteria group bacterium]|nr:aspartate carbamoyltransferase [Patescibacteria group bacterium]